MYFRDDDDINDVASMAGVNLNEENARILATGSELVGTQIRSCKDEAFLPANLLHKRILEIGREPQHTLLSTNTLEIAVHEYLHLYIAVKPGGADLNKMKSLICMVFSFYPVSFATDLCRLVSRAKTFAAVLL